MEPVSVVPNEYGDWLSQRGEDFNSFIPVGEKGSPTAIFKTFSLGLATGRDAWVYNFSVERLRANVSRMIANYNAEVGCRSVDDSYVPDRDPSKISWNRNLDQDFARGRGLELSDAAWRTSTYRPFTKVRSYFDRSMNAMLYQQHRIFPGPSHDNLGFAVMGPREEARPAVLATDCLPDLATFTYAVQFFPRWTWEPVDDEGFDFGGPPLRHRSGRGSPSGGQHQRRGAAAVAGCVRLGVDEG